MSTVQAYAVQVDSEVRDDDTVHMAASDLTSEILGTTLVAEITLNTEQAVQLVADLNLIIAAQAAHRNGESRG